MLWKVYGRVTERPELRDLTLVFRDRDEAGRVLAQMMEEFRGTDAIVLGIPAGGAAVAAVLARELGLPLDVAVVNKVTPPWNSEVGYGGVAFDGTVLLNEEALPLMGLSDREVEEGIAKTREKVLRRLRLLRGDRPLPPLAKRTVILVDDGLATGSTMRVAVRALKNAGADRIVVALPTGHEQAVERLAREVDAVYCANVRGGHGFAVANAYEYWSDLSEADVAAILQQFHAAEEAP